MARFNPMARGRGTELKVQLVRASIAAIEAIRNVDPRARFVQIDPVINVVPKTRVTGAAPRRTGRRSSGVGHAGRKNMAGAGRQAGIFGYRGR